MKLPPQHCVDARRAADAAGAGRAGRLARVAWWLHSTSASRSGSTCRARGEARSNPLYVLKLALRADGVEGAARRGSNLASAGTRCATRHRAAVQRSAHADAATTSGRCWTGCADGGHLLLRTPPPGSSAPRHQRAAAVAAAGGADADATGQTECVPAARWPGRTRTWSSAEAAASLSARTARPCRRARAAVWATATTATSSRASRTAAGFVDVLADFDFLDNDKLKDGPHVALTRQLLAPNYRAGTVHLVYAAQMPSFWCDAAARTAGWPGLPLLLALLAWLWRRMQRFGPLLPAPAGERRSLLEHVVASGEHRLPLRLRAPAARRRAQRLPRAPAPPRSAGRRAGRRSRRSRCLAERFGVPADRDPRRPVRRRSHATTPPSAAASPP